MPPFDAITTAHATMLSARTLAMVDTHERPRLLPVLSDIPNPPR
jgi:hypothetical protein